MAFTNRVFATFLAARTVDLLGTALTPVVLTLVALEETKSASATGVVLAANVLPMLVFMLAGGVLADTFPRSRILTATAAASAATQAAMAGLLFSDAFNLGAMAALSAASGILAAFSGPALRGIVPDLVAPGDIQRANAALATSKNATRILGPALAGVLVTFVGGGWALLADAVTSLFAAILFARLPRLSQPRPARMWADLREGWQAFSRLRWVWTLALSYAIINLLLIGPWQILGPTIIGRSHSEAWWGVVLSVRAAGLVVASVALMRLRFRNPLPTGLILGSLTGLPLIALGLSDSIAVLIGVVFVSAFAATAAAITYDSTLQTQVPRGELSRVSSFDDALSFATVPLSQLLVGPAALAFGATQVALFCGFALVAAHLIPLLVPDVRTVSRA